MKKIKQVGFTLVEILVVLAIIGMLAGLVGPKVLKAFSGAKSDTALVQIRDFEQALEIYLLDTGNFPSSDQGLEALVVKPSDAAGWNGPYLRRKDVPKDPWNKAYLYRYPGEHADVDIFSYGSDGQSGGEGDKADVGNWQ